MFVQFTLLLHKNIYKKYNNDSIDRLHQIYVPNILITFALLFLLKLLATPSIYCFENAYELEMWNPFINSYCFIEDMYFVSHDSIEIPIGPTRKSVNTNYYPWIPVVFVSQAILCMVPYYFWETLNYKTGIFIRQLSAALALTDEKARKVMKEKGSTIRSKIGAAKILLETLKYNSNRMDRIFGLLPPRSYLSILYIFYKLLNLVNITGQLLFLNQFLNTRYTFWGAEILWDLYHKIGWKSSGHFPRVIYCDFPRREDSTGHFFESTAQCLIAFNFFNEVLFIGIWFLFCALIIINAISIFKLLLFVFRKESRIEFIEDLLKGTNIDRFHPNFNYFVHNILGKDGCLTLRLLSSNSIPFTISQFTHELFKQYKNFFPDKCFVANV